MRIFYTGFGSTIPGNWRMHFGTGGVKESNTQEVTSHDTHTGNWNCEKYVVQQEMISFFFTHSLEIILFTILTWECYWNNFNWYAPRCNILIKLRVQFYLLLEPCWRLFNSIFRGRRTFLAHLKAHKSTGCCFPSVICVCVAFKLTSVRPTVIVQIMYSTLNHLLFITII